MLAEDRGRVNRLVGELHPQNVGVYVKVERRSKSILSGAHQFQIGS